MDTGIIERRWVLRGVALGRSGRFQGAHDADMNGLLTGL